VALLTDADNDDPNDNDRVSLMTDPQREGPGVPVRTHRGLGGGPVPQPDGGAQPADLEEERRLFYVALTRAEKRAR
jgi:DNA helicase-2/ATP-dependent DNA helicase PcrA